MATLSHRSPSRFDAGRRSRTAVATVSILPLLALTFATLETAIVFAGENLLRALGVAP